VTKQNIQHIDVSFRAPSHLTTIFVASKGSIFILLGIPLLDFALADSPARGSRLAAPTVRRILVWIARRTTGLPRLQRRPPKNTPSSPASTDCPAHSNHGHRIDCPERARFPEAAARFPEQQEAGRQDQEGWKGWQEMGEGRRSGLQDSQDRH